MAKKKKKKKKTGAARSTYAKGKAPSSPAKGRSTATTSAAGRSGKAPGGGGAATSKAGGQADRPVAQFNLIKRGTLEMKVFQALLAILIAAALVQYPLWAEVAARDFKVNLKKYNSEIKKWEEKYTTEKQREKNEDEKPVKPRKPTFNDFIVFYAFMSFIEGGLFAFIGLNVSRRTDLSTPLLDGALGGEGAEKGLIDLFKYGVPAGIAVTVPLLVNSLVGRSLGYSKTIQVQYAAWKDSLYYAGFGVQNQMLLVFLVMSSLVWLFTRYRGRTKVEPHLAGLCAAVVLGFTYFFYVSRAGAEKTSVGLVASALLAVSLVAIPGYLFWKKGLEYSLLAGAIGFGIYPFLAGFIIK